MVPVACSLQGYPHRHPRRWLTMIATALKRIAYYLVLFISLLPLFVAIGPPHGQNRGCRCGYPCRLQATEICPKSPKIPKIPENPENPENGDLGHISYQRQIFWEKCQKKMHLSAHGFEKWPKIVFFHDLGVLGGFGGFWGVLGDFGDFGQFWPFFPIFGDFWGG